MGLPGASSSEPAVHVTGLTLSTQQLAYAQRELSQRGLAGKSDLRLQDYRDANETYDRIVSVEMLEAVGEAYWPTFFANLRQRLNPQGAAVLQVITIDQSRFEGYRRRPEFIQRYIFPGGMLPTTEIIEQLVANAGLAAGLIGVLRRQLCPHTRRVASTLSGNLAVHRGARI